MIQFTYYIVYLSEQIDELDKVTVEDDVFDTRLPGSDEACDVEEGQNEIDVTHMAPQDAIGKEKCITFCFKILHLLQTIHGLVCKRNECERQLEYRETFCGTCLVVSRKCSAGHFGGSCMGFTAQM